MLNLDLKQFNAAFNRLVSRPFQHTAYVNFVAVTPAQNPTESLEKASGPLSEKRSRTVRLGSVRPGTVRPPATFYTADEDIVGSMLASASPPADKSSDESEKISIDVPLEQRASSGDLPELSPPSETSMDDYYQLQVRLLGLTIAFTAFVFPFVWGFYSLHIALNYSLGACAGVVYLRMLAKNVSVLGRDQKKNSSIGRLAVFAGIMIVALRLDQLDVVPVFLGFLTYKAAIMAFVLWTALFPEQTSRKATSREKQEGAA